MQAEAEDPNAEINRLTVSFAAAIREAAAAWLRVEGVRGGPAGLVLTREQYYGLLFGLTNVAGHIHGVQASLVQQDSDPERLARHIGELQVKVEAQAMGADVLNIAPFIR